jgi:8-oxo-dGTP pyrophosphatase MutT (NUDIX family)
MDEAEGKVVAYVVRGDELLVFVHVDDGDPLLESGLQVPAGTMHEGESPDDAVLREAREETGLTGLRIVRALGEDTVCWPGRRPQHRRFFHLELANPANAPDSWVHIERDEGSGSPRPFRCFWVSRRDAPLLAGAQGVFVARIDE